MRVTKFTICVLVMLAVWSTSAVVSAQVIAAGQFQLDPSTGPGHPDFNSALTAMHTIPIDLGSTTGSHLSIGLRDISRPDMVCDLDDDFGDLFNGCAAVDWPFMGRRGINQLDFDTDSGTGTLFLRIGDTLSLEPEPLGP